MGNVRGLRASNVRGLRASSLPGLAPLANAYALILYHTDSVRSPGRGIILSEQCNTSVYI